MLIANMGCFCPAPHTIEADGAGARANESTKPLGKPSAAVVSPAKVIGMTVDEAIDRVSSFLDDTLITDIQQVRIVHGHGTGALRKGLQAFLKTHPLVEKHYPAPENQGGGGATIVELKD